MRRGIFFHATASVQTRTKTKEHAAGLHSIVIGKWAGFGRDSHTMLYTGGEKWCASQPTVPGGVPIFNSIATIHPARLCVSRPAAAIPIAAWLALALDRPILTALSRTRVEWPISIAAR